jgi:hypothetical protein
MFRFFTVRFSVYNTNILAVYMWGEREGLFAIVRLYLAGLEIDIVVADSVSERTSFLLTSCVISNCTNHLCV